MMNLNPFYEIYLGALNLSPYVVDIVIDGGNYDGNGRFELCCKELPLELKEDITLVSKFRERPTILYGLNYTPQAAWIFRMKYRPLNSQVLAIERPLLNRALFPHEPVYFIEGAFVDSIPF